MQPLPNAGINPDSRVPVFEQIKNLIQFAILSEDYREGDQLPPVLALSREVGVNLNTVAKAYRDLEVTGIISTRRGMGCFVKKNAADLCRRMLLDAVFSRLRESLLEAKAAGVPRREIDAFVRRCLAEDTGPYSVSETPSPVSRQRQGNQPGRT